MDAAHGASDCTGSGVQRIDIARGKSQITRVVVAGRVGRRTVVVAIRADIRQGPRLTAADARSRSSDSNRWNGWAGRTAKNPGADWDV